MKGTVTPRYSRDSIKGGFYMNDTTNDFLFLKTEGIERCGTFVFSTDPAAPPPAFSVDILMSNETIEGNTLPDPNKFASVLSAPITTPKAYVIPSFCSEFIGFKCLTAPSDPELVRIEFTLVTKKGFI